MSGGIVQAFNNHFVEFLEDVHTVFPEDVDVLAAKNSLLAIKKANPKLIVKIWKTFITDKYDEQINNGDLSFFIDKDYKTDVADAKNMDQIMDGINRLREPIRNMTAANQAKTMKYIQNLTKLSKM